MTSGRLNETLSTGIFDMRLTEESVAIKAKKTESGEHRRRSRNGCKLAMLVEIDFVLVKLLSMSKNVKSVQH